MLLREVADVLGVHLCSAQRYLKRLGINHNCITKGDIDRLKAYRDSARDRSSKPRVFYRISVLDINTGMFFVKKAGLKRVDAELLSADYTRHGIISHVHRCDGKE